MRKIWAYLLDENIAPVWLGEIGSADVPNEGDKNYWKHLIRFLRQYDNVGFGYWAINPQKPLNKEYESYSLVDDDWQKGHLGLSPRGSDFAGTEHNFARIIEVKCRTLL
jgi:endoglucanase